MDDIDRKILNMIQEGFPVDRRPFRIIGEMVGLNEEMVLNRIKALKEKGVIRRIGPILERKRLGYESVLCGLHVEEDKIVEIAKAINRHSGVTHNYERDGELNLWFTITAKTKKEIDTFLADVERRFSIRIYRFPEKRMFKIKTYFPV
ncbi:MAG TPA: AsnC family transcriptional regulator [Syntrophorhabdaceae bacterium]|nr:AsnC family transcriptional regulator [Syntrophorhabdaceae bacterium]HOL05164.1 AsnC family transcriptional regulator [Syntrophorhabdaceae bacterium]HON84744.1 AsnC family transcriptional regulator [Syntrophorhabdaceae bacterium]HPC66271.1 AsnC family transcriptional regulator [Syntrophorhabdaceae bacterium]HPP41421.1 AsnC family transcriptional regulator [Syntrophorhabdaceae bacterium]